MSKVTDYTMEASRFAGLFVILSFVCGLKGRALLQIFLMRVIGYQVKPGLSAKAQHVLLTR